MTPYNISITHHFATSHPTIEQFTFHVIHILTPSQSILLIYPVHRIVLLSCNRGTESMLEAVLLVLLVLYVIVDVWQVVVVLGLDPV